MALEIKITDDALHSFKKMQPEMARRLKNKIIKFSEDHKQKNKNVTTLKGTSFVRLRVGDYRAIIRIGSSFLTVIRVGHRSEIYD